MPEGFERPLNNRSPGEKLIAACMRGDTLAALRIIEYNAEVIDFVNASGFTPLMWASNRGLPGVVKALLAKGANVNALNRSGSTALLMTCCASAGEPVGPRLLASRQASALLLLDDPDIDVHARNSSGQTALSCCGNRMPAVRARLLALGAREEGGAAAAAGGGGGAGAAAAGAAAVHPARAAKLGQQLLSACENRNTARALAIIRAGEADLNFKDDVTGFTPLIWASADGLTDVVAALLATKQVDVNAVNGWRSTALIDACQNSHEAVALALLDVPGINVNAKNGDGRTALAWCSNGRMPAVRARLLALGAREEGEEFVVVLREEEGAGAGPSESESNYTRSRRNRRRRRQSRRRQSRRRR